MKTHYLKTVQPYFNETWNDIKLFEHRKNDRDFQVNDIVFLREFCQKYNSFTGFKIKVKITFVLKNFQGLDPDYCVFSFEILNKEVGF